MILRWLLSGLGVWLWVGCSTVSEPLKLEPKVVARMGEYLAVNGSDDGETLRVWLDGLELRHGAVDEEILRKEVELRWVGMEPIRVDRILASSRVSPSYTKEKLMRAGRGLPVVLWQTAEGSSERDFMSRSGRAYGATVRMLPRKSEGAQPILELVELNTAEKRGWAADFSAAEDFFWENCPLNNDAFLALFRPGEKGRVPQLYCSEPVDMARIPVICVHGLQSSPVIYARFAARLKADPLLRERFQLWSFAYPSGTPWLLTGAEFRTQVTQARRLLDSAESNANWDDIVLVGHSMGGLISRLSISHVDDEIYATVFERPLDELRGDERSLEFIKQTFLFEPLDEPTRVVFMATPHRGSSLADLGLVRMISSLIRLPVDVVQNTVDILTANQFALTEKTGSFKRLPTSIDTLSPESAIIQAINQTEMRPNLAKHSIIGVKDFSLFGGKGDGVVPYRSASIDGVESEVIVPHGHSLVAKRESVDALVQILDEHLGLEEPVVRVGMTSEVERLGRLGYRMTAVGYRSGSVWRAGGVLNSRRR